jgi:acetolactate synthase I/II/III large subunit
MKGTDWMVEYLVRQASVTHVFTYAGGTSAWLLDAVARAKGIQVLPMRHEQNAAFAADGYARASGRVGVAATMSGPGATNLVTGIADAFFDSVPILFLTSQVTTSTYKFDRPVRQLGYQETDIVSITRPITKSARIVLTAAELMREFRNGIGLSLSMRRGPVLLDIPSDVQRLDMVETDLTPPPTVEWGPNANASDVKAALALMTAAHRPLILAGGGIRTSGSSRLLVELAERLQIPVVVSLMGKDAFPHNHPLFVGFIGSYGNRYANLTLANCDLLIALGSRMDSRQTANPKTFARGAKKIHVDIDKYELNNTVTSELAIHAHLKSFFDEALKAAAGQPRGKYDDWFDYIREVRAKFYNEDFGSDQLVNPKSFLRKFADFTQGNEIFLPDVGNHQMWAAQELRLNGEQRFITSGGLGTMGFAIPAGIGAHFARPECPIIAFVGDGGFQMSLPELQTIVHNQVPIKIVVFNNQILGLMWHFQNENFSSGLHPATEEGYSCPDVQRIASAYGIPSRRADDNDLAERSIEWLISERGPAILELAIDRSWAGYPKVKPGNPLEGQLPEIDKDLLARFMLIPMLEK